MQSVRENRSAGDRWKTSNALDVQRVRSDFPALQQRVHGKPLVFLDSAASAQKPRVVIDAVAHFYAQDYANIHRGVYELSERATRAFEGARRKVQQFLNAAQDREIVFLRSTTEAINLVASSYGRGALGPGDEVIISAMEHHSNIVPWQLVCQERGAVLRVVPIDDAGQLLVGEYEKLFSRRTKFVSLAHVSNALGTINPVRRLIEIAHRHGVPVLLDGAQAVPHLRVDVQQLDCDFYAFSGHKLYGPTGTGVLYGKAALLDSMPPYQGGGEMIRSVTFEKTVYNRIPYKFEAGTPNIAGVVGLGVAIDYVTSLGLDAIAAHEDEVLRHATERVSAIPGVRIIGTAADKAGVLSLVIDGVHPHDIGTILDREGIAIRAGHHCAQPVMQRFHVPATARASFGVYNSKDDVDVLADAIAKVKEVFA